MVSLVLRSSNRSSCNAPASKLLLPTASVLWLLSISLHAADYRHDGRAHYWNMGGRRDLVVAGGPGAPPITLEIRPLLPLLLPFVKPRLHCADSAGLVEEGAIGPDYLVRIGMPEEF